ncbi:MAG: DEAD/DEAH box helicase [Acidobacteria bacterium]|nr:DEAD/DEAH box helicase [Acidobacteriota bacterium]
MNIKTFQELHLSDAILRALRDEGYRQPTDIQSAAIPEVLAGKDVMATAQTGTGKTAAFCLPMLDMLHRRKRNGLRALILTPTRELALQIETSLRAYGRYLPLKSSVVVGGVSMGGQIRSLQHRPDILVATPGRLLDLMRQKHVRLHEIEFLVLDEADRMLDMGFIQDVRTIVSHVPAARQTLLLSATLSSEVAALASDMLRNPVPVATAPPASVAVKVDQKVLFVDQADKGSLLVDILQRDDVRRALVFTRTKHRADRLMRHLSRNGISADAIHSNKSQNGRQRSLAAFDKGRITVLVATDIVARGIDVDGITHVINYELPNDAENYVHRVGRTARAGAAGIALSFCDATEILMLKGIEKLIKHELPAVEEHAFHSTTVASLHRERPGASGRSVQWRSFSPRGRFGRRPGRLGR